MSRKTVKDSRFKMGTELLQAIEWTIDNTINQSIEVPFEAYNKYVYYGFIDGPKKRRVYRLGAEHAFKRIDPHNVEKMSFVAWSEKAELLETVYMECLVEMYDNKKEWTIVAAYNTDEMCVEKAYLITWSSEPVYEIEIERN